MVTVELGSSFQVLAEKQGMVEGLAYDGSHDTLYWTCHSDPTINKMALADANASVVEVVRLPADDKPRGIALDSCDAYVHLQTSNWVLPS